MAYGKCAGCGDKGSVWVCDECGVMYCRNCADSFGSAWLRGLTLGALGGVTCPKCKQGNLHG